MNYRHRRIKNQKGTFVRRFDIHGVIEKTNPTWLIPATPEST